MAALTLPTESHSHRGDSLLGPNRYKTARPKTTRQISTGQRRNRRSGSVHPPNPKEDCAAGQREGDEVELNEASLFLLIVGHVERIDHRLHAGIGTPERQPQAER